MESMMECPKCGASRASEALDCMTCRIVFAKYKGRPMQGSHSAAAIVAPKPAALEELVEDADLTKGVWQRGNTLIVGRFATLPDRCVSCNAPAERRLTRKLSWHKAWVYVFLLINLIVYAVAAAIARKKAEVDVPLCAHHLKVRRYGVLGAWGFMGVGILAAIVSSTPSDGPVSMLPMVIFLGSAVVAMIMGFTISRPVIATRIDDEFVWLGKCGKSFLSSLPEAPKGI